MHIFYFPNGDRLSCKDLHQACAIAALSPVGTLLDSSAEQMFRMKSEFGFIGVSSEEFQRNLEKYETKAKARLRAEALKRAGSGVVYTLEARCKAVI